MACRCAFYGFMWPERSNRLLATGDNRCALEFDGSTPCAMETGAEIPDEERCTVPLRNPTFLQYAKKVVKFFPPEHPEGLTYAQWRAECRKKPS